MLVDEVQRVARELDATGLLPLDEVGGVGACEISQSSAIVPSTFQYLSNSSLALLSRKRCKRTGDLPQEIVADVLVLGRHFELRVWLFLRLGAGEVV